MFRFTAEGITVTEQAVHIHGVWDLNGARRFSIVRVPIGLMTADSVLEALNQAHSDAQKTAHDAQQEWEQFLLWG